MFFCVIYGGIFCIMFNLIKFLFDMAVGLETTLSLVQNLFGHSKQCRLKLFNPLTPMSDQDRIFPDNVNTISTREVMRIKKNTNFGITSWSNSKFSDLTL